MSIITIQTLAPNIEDNTIALEYLQDFGVVFGQATRTAFSMRNRIGKTKTKASELEKTICLDLETRFGLSNSEAKNAYNKASTIYDSQSALVDTYIDENYDRIKGIRKTIKKLELKLKRAEDYGQSSTVRKLKKKSHYKQQKINKLDAKIVRLKESKANGTFSVTFGSSKLFEKKYRLKENGYNSREEWLEDWRTERYNRSFFIGSKNFQAGNQLVRYDAEYNTLTITVSPCLRAKYGASVTLYDITFSYGEKWLLAAVKPVRYTSTRNSKNGEKVETSRNGSTVPVTYDRGLQRWQVLC